LEDWPIIELDKSRSGGKRGLAGGSIFSSNPASVPSELQPLVEPQQQLTKFVLSTKTSVNAADHDYDKLTGPSAVAPSPPVHAARLNGLLKTLANAEGAVAESIKARKVLIEGLEKILDTNRHALLAEESLLLKTQNRWTEIDTKKKDVEDSIMRGFASNSNPGTPAQPGENSPGIDRSLLAPVAEPDRPEVEALTPPGYPIAPPPTEPIPKLELASENSNGTMAPPVQPVIITSEGRQTASDTYPLGGPNYAYARPASAASASSAKKRKLNNDDFLDLGDDDGLDADVADILRRDSGQGL
jgi:regulator of Ty1 transposition protein 103